MRQVAEDVVKAERIRDENVNTGRGGGEEERRRGGGGVKERKESERGEEELTKSEQIRKLQKELATTRKVRST